MQKTTFAVVLVLVAVTLAGCRPWCCKKSCCPTTAPVVCEEAGYDNDRMENDVK